MMRMGPPVFMGCCYGTGFIRMIASFSTIVKYSFILCNLILYKLKGGKAFASPPLVPVVCTKFSC